MSFCYHVWQHDIVLFYMRIMQNEWQLAGMQKGKTFLGMNFSSDL